MAFLSSRIQEEGHCDLAKSLHFCFVSSLYVLQQKWKGDIQHLPKTDESVVGPREMEGGQSGTYQRLTIGVIGSAGERHEDIEMK